MYVRPTLTGLPSSSAEGGLAHFVGGGICLVAWGKDEHSPSDSKKFLSFFDEEKSKKTHFFNAFLKKVRYWVCI